MDEADTMLDSLTVALGHEGGAESGNKATLDGKEMTQEALTGQLMNELKVLRYSDPNKFFEVLDSTIGHSNTLRDVFKRYFPDDAD
jgi:hypothetical protein